LVEDKTGTCSALKDQLAADGHQVVTVHSGEEGLKQIEERSLDVVVTDVGLSGMDGLAFLQEAQKRDPRLPVIAMSSFGPASQAVEAMKHGAFDFVEKPLELNHLGEAVARALEQHSAWREPATRGRESLVAPWEQGAEMQSVLPATEDVLIGKSSKIRQTYRIVEQLARSASTTVQIIGETGTGKELIARAIHYTSLRRNERFTEINCAALAETLLESELFGYERGAFTGAATAGKIGLFEATHRGSIFLDEISEMGVNLQAKLLRVLQEKRFKRVGGIEDIEVDVRIITSTNIDLRDAVRQGKFREDLFYRLDVVPIRVPPLRERREDIPLIADYFLKKFAAKFDRPLAGFTRAAKRRLLAYRWPGNVRELKNVVERATILEPGEVISEQSLLLPSRRAEALDLGPNALILTDRRWAAVEKKLIERVLQEAYWQRSEAARVLGIHRTTLANKIKEYGLMPKTEGDQ